MLLLLLSALPASARDITFTDPLANGSTADDVYGGTFTGAGWRIDDANSRQMWDFGTQVDHGTVSVTIDDITLDNLQGDNNHLIELFDDGDHFSCSRAINFRVYGPAGGESGHGDIKLKAWEPNGYAEARGGVQDWDGGPHTWTITWDASTAILYRDGAAVVNLDVSGLDLRVGKLWLPINYWGGDYSAPIGALYSNLSVNVGEPGDDGSSDTGPADDGDPTTFVPIEDAGITASGPGDVDDLAVQNEGGAPVEAAYVMYDLSSLSGTVTSAILTLHVRNASSSGGSGATVYSVAETGWSEDTLDWAGRPATGSALGTTPTLDIGATAEIDVTAAVSAGGRVAFALVGSGEDGTHFSSKEDGDGSGAAVLTVLTTPSSGDGGDNGGDGGNGGDDDTSLTGDDDSGAFADSAGPDVASGACGCATGGAAGGGPSLLLALGLARARRRSTAAAPISRR